jgi:hypothetical protein
MLDFFTACRLSGENPGVHDTLAAWCILSSGRKVEKKVKIDFLDCPRQVHISCKESGPMHRARRYLPPETSINDPVVNEDSSERSHRIA